MENPQDIRYRMAKKRVKEIKSFYTHLIVYLLVNAFLLIRKIDFSNLDALRLSDFYVLIFWGIGLFFHGLNVFCIGKNWEDRKIKKLMDADKRESEKWE